MNTNRVEAFSDGVLAVAITLLVLDLHVDRNSSLSLAAQFRAEWPTFAAYMVSFFFIGVIWLNHHSLFRIATGVDRRVLVYNLMLLLFVTAIPFTTSTYAQYAQQGGMDAKVAVLAYGAVMEGVGIAFVLILARLQSAGLTGAELTAHNCNKLLVRYGIGALTFPVITLVGWFYPPAMLVLYAAIIGYYLGPGVRTLESLTGSD